MTVIISDDRIMANPRVVEWGSAPILVRSTHQAGKIRIIARPTYEGIHAPAADTLEISSVPYEGKMCYELNSTSKVANRPAGWRNAGGRHIPRTQENLTEEERRKMLEEVEKQQQDFGIQ